MRRDHDARVAALEGRQRPPVPPVDPLKARFEAMSIDEIDVYLADPPPLPDDAAAELADLAERLERMTDQELDAYLANQWTTPYPKERHP